MALQTQYVPVELGGKLDQKTDERLVVPGNFINLENTVYTKTGSVRKRPGNDLLARTVVGGGSLPAPRSLVGYRDTLLMFGNDNMYAFAANESTWYNKGQIPEPTVAGDVIASAQPNVLGAATSPAQGSHWLTCAKANGITVYLYEDASGGSLYSTAIDDYGNVIFANTPVGGVTHTNPRIVAVGRFIIALYSDDTHIYAQRLDTATPTGWGTQTDITPAGTAKSAVGLWDACSLTDRFAIVYHAVVAGSDVVVTATFDSSLSVMGTPAVISQVLVPNIEIAAIAADHDQNSIWIAWITDDAVNWYFNCRQYDLTLNPATGTGLTQIDTGALGGGIARYRSRIGVALLNSGANALFVCNTPADDTDDSTIIDNVTGTGNATAGAVNALYPRKIFYSRIALVSKPFLLGPNYYVAVRDRNESTFYLANLGVADFPIQLMIPVATYADRAASNNDDTVDAVYRRSLLCDVVALSSTSVLIPGFTHLGDVLNVSGFTVSFDTPFTFSESNEALCISGGLPGSYAGNQFVELGFLQKPIVFTASPATDAGVGVPAGTYRYIVVFEWTDENGQLFRSQPSDLYTRVLGAEVQSININISYIAFTRKQRFDADVNAVRVVIYRESPAGTGIYRRLTQVTNNVTQLGFIFKDNGSYDANLVASTDLLYTLSELPNSHPPSARYVLTHQGRVWLAGFDDSTLLWASKQLSAGEAPNFSEALRLHIHDGGAITGLASMDNKLVVFKKDRIYVVVGEGPNDLGGANDWQIQRVAADTGCINGRSIVTTRDGVFYQAPIGICMLSRALEVLYVGDQVEDTVKLYGTITDAVNHTSQPWVLFSLGPQNGHGVTLHYDYYHRKWSKWFFNDTVGSDTQAFAKSLTMFNNRFTWVTSAGVPYRESATFLDNGTYVSMVVVSAWLKFAGLVGFQRIRALMLLGASQSPHNLTISIAHNYDNTTYDQSNTFSYTLLSWPSEQFAVKLVQQKSSAIRFKLQDTQHVNGLGTGEGLILSGMGFEVGVKAPLFGNLPITQGG